MKPVLVVEDEKDISDLIEYHLKQAGFPVAIAREGAEALEKAVRERPGLILLDLMLPGMDGKDVCRALKSNPATRAIPVMMVTARAEEVDRIIGFELGADDYITKPFSPRELVLRVKAVLRRGEDLPAEEEKVLRPGSLVIDVARHQVLAGGQPVELTSTEFRLLVELATRRGRVQTRETLLNRVWGYTYEGYARTVDTHIRRLREKLGPSGHLIETLRGVGYRFREEDV
jgi:two-component system, OmpR family, phosphate regulon response regulator PhoB